MPSDLVGVLRSLGPGRVPLVPGWATVELERGSAAVAASLGPSARIEAAPDDPLLGASCLLVRSRAEVAVVLEPSTEGRLAAFLARHGEGLAATYAQADAAALERARAAGIELGPVAPGPLGPERLAVTGGDRTGPFLLLVVAAAPAR